MYSDFFHDFIKRGLLAAIGERPDYWIMLNAANWMDKGALIENDLFEIQTAINTKNMAIVSDDKDEEEAGEDF